MMMRREYDEWDAKPWNPNRNYPLNPQTLTKTQNTTPTKREMMRREDESLVLK